MKMILTSIIVALLAGFVLQGCATTHPTGAASAVYSDGTLTANYDGNVFKTADATIAALKDFNMTVTNSRQDASGGRIDARRADGTAVSISLRALGSDVTVAGIAADTVGPFGDEEFSRAVSRKIEDRLEG